MSFFALFKTNDQDFRKNFTYFVIAYFLVYVNYSLIRASSITMFFEAFGAKSTPAALLGSIVILGVAIACCNKLQVFFPVQKVFLWASLFSTLVFSGASLGFIWGHKPWAYFLFIWKEIYIVIQVHLLLAYANHYFAKNDFKKILGPIGAIGSLGGVLGGLLTSAISDKMGGTNVVMAAGIFFVFCPAVLFLFTKHLVMNEVGEKRVSPLQSLNQPSIRQYVFTLAAIVAVTQFMINILDFKFNLVFEAAIQNSSDRTSYLGTLYTATNFVTMIFMAFLLPFILPRVSEKNYHLFIPLSYLVCMLGLTWGMGAGLLPVALTYVYVKAADYSLFSAGKEILYQPLTPSQKYGAKYLTDMLVYRSSKALIAAVLIYLQSSTILNMMMYGLLLCWMYLIIRLFRLKLA